MEVLVAFAILSLSLGVLYQIFSTSLRNAALSSQYSRAMIIAESQLAASMEEQPLVEISRQGLVDELYHWQVNVFPYQEAEESSAPFIPYQVDVAVSWKEGKFERTYQLHTLRLGEP